MGRSIWTGSLSFGLVNVPVGLHTATQDKAIAFHEFQRGTSARIRHKRVSQDTGEEVEFSDIVKGYEVGDGSYVLLEPEELEAVEPGRSRTIEVTDFVDQAEIDPIYYSKTYYLAPRGEEAAKPYSLLHQTMAKSGRIGIATIVMRSKQYLAAVRPEKEVLALETMYFADEVRDPKAEIGTPLPDFEFKGRELEVAKALIESLTTKWEPENYRDDYRHRVMDLIASKNAGEIVEPTNNPGPKSNVLDLMDALERSLETSKTRRASGKKSTTSDQSGAEPSGKRSGPAKKRKAS